MIPILFASTETAFTSQGLGRLQDARKCEVTEERNGQYELVMEYSANGPLAEKLIPGNYIYCTHDDNGDFQAFEIYKVSAPLEGFISVNAWHISYKLNSIVVAPFTANSCANALAAIPTNSYNTNNFTFQTDKTVSATFSFDTPRSARSLLGGSEGSILDVYGKGEYEFDMFTVKLLLNRGSNKGVVIRYGKDLRKLDYDLDSSNKHNAVVPYWTNEENALVLDHLVVRTGETANNAIPLDLSSKWESEPTTAELETAAQAYIDNTNDYKVRDNLKIDFIPLWQTEEYKSFATNSSKVKLCDTVTIYYEKYGINAAAKVIKVIYDVLLDRYSSMELGEPQTTLSQQIQQDVSGGILAEVPSIATRMLSSISFSTSGDISAANLTASETIIGKNLYVKQGANTYDVVTTKVTDITSSVTAGTNVTMGGVGSVKQNGKVVCGYLQFTLTSSLSAYAYVFTGLPACATGVVFPLLNNNNTTNTSANLYADSGNTGLRVTGALSSGTYKVYFNYISA